jgi:hypothetical protein
MSAKREETRASRFAVLVDASAHGRKNALVEKQLKPKKSGVP